MAPYWFLPRGLTTGLIVHQGIEPNGTIYLEPRLILVHCAYQAKKDVAPSESFDTW
jgi:hypothetical protein